MTDCPDCGHILYKMKPNSRGKCPDNLRESAGKCQHYDNCQFNYKIQNCFWCYKCRKHFVFLDKEVVVFT